MATKDTGRYGEMLAMTHLQQRGYEILTTNWRCSQGEIDIVARDGETVVFVEVRTRHDNTDTALQSVNVRKQEKLQNLAYTYLDMHQLEQASWRIDVIAIFLPRQGHHVIEQVENALDW